MENWNSRAARKRIVWLGIIELPLSQWGGGARANFALADVGLSQYPCPTNMAKALPKSQIVASLAETVGLTTKHTAQTLEALVALGYMNAKNSFTIPGLGKIVLLNRKWPLVPVRGG